MPRTKRSATLDTRARRLQQPLGKRLMETIGRGAYLLYQRPKNGRAGSWYARWFDLDTKKQVQVRLAEADDLQEADGAEVLTFAQAQAAASRWFAARTREAVQAAGGDLPVQGPYTVRDALRDYLADAKRRGMKGLLITTQTTNAHILPALGDLPVAKLTRRRLEDWHQALAESPRKTSGRRADDDEPAPDPAVPSASPLSEEARRKRKVTANRILTILRAALNQALAQRRISDPPVWREVKPFKGVEVARARFLSIEEQRRLVQACEPDFRTLVEAALFTGARYGELTRLRVQDFNARTGTVFIETSKSGHSRHIWLTDEARAWFTSKTAGRPLHERLLTRRGAKRTRRKGLVEDQAWAPYDQVYLMAEACERAGLSPVTFHELRHTYASLLVNRGVPLAYVASQLGHRDTTMVQKYYGHLSPDAIAEAIRTQVPNLGLAALDRVIPLQVARGGGQG